MHSLIGSQLCPRITCVLANSKNSCDVWGEMLLTQSVILVPIQRLRTAYNQWAKVCFTNLQTMYSSSTDISPEQQYMHPKQTGLHDFDILGLSAMAAPDVYQQSMISYWIVKLSKFNRCACYCLDGSIQKCPCTHTCVAISTTSNRNWGMLLPAQCVGLLPTQSIGDKFTEDHCCSHAANMLTEYTCSNSKPTQTQHKQAAASTTWMHLISTVHTHIHDWQTLQPRHDAGGLWLKDPPSH